MRWKSMTYSGWGRVLKAKGDMTRPERLSAFGPLPMVPAFGGRRSYGDACLNSDGSAIDMTRMDRIIGFDDKTGQVDVEAGMEIGELTRIMAPKGWLPAVVPGTGFATVGGCIAMDVHGKNHHKTGSFGAHVLSVRLLQGAKPRTISPGATPTLFRATTGGLGQTGVILSARLQMVRAGGQSMEVRERRAADLNEHLDMLEGSDASFTVGWLDATATGDQMGRGVVEEAEIGFAPPPAAGKPRSVPFDAPGFTLSRPTVRLFNGRYFARIPEDGRTRTRSFSDFFFPLDRIHHWNRLYGKRGFHQFQCAVPLNARDAIADMVATVSGSGLASPLSVLKRLGATGSGLMSFPIEGFTLAVDLRNRPTTPEVIQKLNQIALSAGGRIYLAKDATATPDMVHTMYPNREEWATQAAKADPEGRLAIDLIRRLKLREL